MFRAPSSTADAVPDTGDPPPASTPRSANCEPPVNMSTDSAQVWPTDSPDAVPSAPNDRAYAPVATPTDSAARST